ncbi:MAG: DUF6273 domain-containing protein, partial [Peptococcaceae bacterium]|nr:DUF6273 domain-containing protein [Peptococcaceae bacterium]
MAIISIKKSVAVTICCAMSCYMIFVGAGSAKAGAALGSTEASAMGSSVSVVNASDTGMDTSSVAVSTSVLADSASDPAMGANDPANNASDLANIAGVPIPTSCRFDDGLDFDAMIGETIYIGTYKHVSSVTFQRPRPTSSSWTQPPTAYESEAEAILWRVMGEEEGDGSLTLLSEYVIDSRRFHENEYWLDYDYVKSEIRAWLNGPFLMEAFSHAENSSLAKTTVIQKMWDPENNEWANGAFTAIWGRSDPAAHTTDFPKIAYGDKVYLPWREYRSNLFHWDAGNKTVQTYAISGETAEVRLRNQRKETDTGNDIRVLSRSPMPESSNHIMPASDSVYSDGNYTTSCYGIRPIVKLIPTRVLYAEKLDEGAYRLTLVNEEI